MAESVIWKNKYSNLTEPKELFTVLIAAAGSGQRLGGVYKPMLKLAGKAMILYSVEALAKSKFVKQIVISVPEDRVKEMKALVKPYAKKVIGVIPGGETRAKSVVNAFRAAFHEKENITPFVAVHDAARPMIDDELLNKVFYTTLTCGGAAAATKVRDAVKHTRLDGKVDAEVDRDGLWQIQTPQCFDTDIFHTALATTPEETAAGAVDDASIVRSAGFDVFCVECGFSNFKVTYPEDIALAEAILAARQAEETVETEETEKTEERAGDKA